METKRKWKKIKDPDTSRTYRNELIELAQDYCGFYPCYHCGHPVHRSYCCTTCGSADPEGIEARYEKQRAV